LPACPTLPWQESAEQLTSNTCDWMRANVDGWAGVEELLLLTLPPQPARIQSIPRTAIRLRNAPSIGKSLRALQTVVNRAS
jgi:hypothetical protein